jgi:UDP-N-acetyl-2-amino-2-deoxyglucuronate dehydrogenase
MWISGTKGIMTVHDASQQIRIYEAPIWHPDADIPVRDITVEALGLNPEDQSSLNELQMKANVAIVNDVLLAREEGRRPVNSGYDGRWALEMIHGIYASHLYGVRLGLPLDNREHPLKDQGI